MAHFSSLVPGLSTMNSILRPTTKAIGIARFDERRGTNVEFEELGVVTRCIGLLVSSVCLFMFIHACRKRLYKTYFLVCIHILIILCIYIYMYISIYTSCIYKLCMVTLFIQD